MDLLKCHDGTSNTGILQIKCREKQETCPIHCHNHEIKHCAYNFDALPVHCIDAAG